MRFRASTHENHSLQWVSFYGVQWVSFYGDGVQWVSFYGVGNDLHLMLKTPRPNFCAGMKSFLSGYAICAARRWRQSGHLFEGGYRARMVEEETYRDGSSRPSRLSTACRGKETRKGN